LLAEDCADIPVGWLEAAASEWAKRQPFMPRACELRGNAMTIGRMMNPVPRLEKREEPPTPPAEPLTDDEIAAMPGWLVTMGIKIGDIDAVRAAKLRA
jgi:hypothetical protein